MNKLEVRKITKAKKPVFKRQCYIRKEVGTKWRAYKGIHSKARLGLRGHQNRVEPGYGSPCEVRGLHKTGLKIVLVNSLLDLAKINPKEAGIVISSNVGMKKAIQILNEAKKKSLHVLNVKADDYLKRIESRLALKKKAKEEKSKKKEQKKKEKPKAEKKEEKPELSEEEKKEAEKAEKEKVLTKKGAM